MKVGKNYEWKKGKAFKPFNYQGVSVAAVPVIVIAMWIPHRFCKTDNADTVCKNSKGFFRLSIIENQQDLEIYYSHK